MTIVWLLIGVLLGALGFLAFFNPKMKMLHKQDLLLKEAELLKRQLEQSMVDKVNQIDELKKNIAIDEQEMKDLSANLLNARVEKARLLSEKEGLLKRVNDMTRRHAEEKAEASRDLAERMEALKLAFSESANKIFEEKSKNLAMSNEKDIKTILDPLKVKMDEFKRTVEETKDKSIKNTASLEEQIKAMMDQTGRISKEANNLASAFRGSNKVQGNWGEVILKSLLERMGLKEGEHFVCQETIRDTDDKAVINEESGKRMIPDVIMYLPEKRAVVIDAKVSLKAFSDYCSAENDQERDEAEKRHNLSVISHYKELAAKSYSRYVKQQTSFSSLDYVIMFMPNESAFQLFYQKNKALWQEAFEKNVIITGEANLFAMLKIIDATWVQIQQQKDVEKMKMAASDLLDVVGKFGEQFVNVGASLTKSMDAYQSAKDKFVGRTSRSKSISRAAMKLKKLNVDSKSFLPGSLIPEDINETSLDASDSETISKDNPRIN
ncbi:MAG: DNA recombination protein RmuC [Bacteroidales bacterium]